MNITITVSKHGFWDGFEGAEALDKAASFGAYLDLIEQRVQDAYPDAAVLVEATDDWKSDVEVRTGPGFDDFASSGWDHNRALSADVNTISDIMTGVWNDGNDWCIESAPEAARV